MTFKLFTSFLTETDSSGTYTVNFKYASGSGSSVTWALLIKELKLFMQLRMMERIQILSTLEWETVTLTGTQTLTNKTLTSPKIGTSILDTNGLQLALLTATGSAVNEFTIANAASGMLDLLYLQQVMNLMLI